MLVGGCSDISPSGATAQLALKKFFDLEGFFDGEVKRLSGFTNLKKTTSVNGEREEQQVERIDFEKELAIFSNSDINRPAWTDKYEVDSVFNEKKELVRLDYQATDEELRTQHVSVSLDGGAVFKIQIENATSTSIADTQQSLIYEPAKGYTIESRQQVQTIDDAVLRIEVAFQ